MPVIAPKHAGKAAVSDRLVQVCEDFAAAGDFEQALSCARDILAQRADKANAHVRVATLLSQMGREAEAMVVLRDADARLPNSAVLQSQLGRAAVRANQLDQAVVHFQAAAALEPKAAGHYAHLSQAYARANQVEQAIAALQEAILRNPNNASFFATLGGLLAQKGDSADAVAAYQDSLKLDPNQPALAELVGRAQARQAVPATRDKTALTGSDGYLFHEVDYAFPQLCGAAPDARDVQRLRTVWQARAAWCAQRGMAYRTLIVPERHVLYGDKLPAGYAPNPDRMAQQLARSGDAYLAQAVIYPLQEMIDGRATREVCYRQDVHWTTYGAYLAYRALIASLPDLAGDALPEADLVAGVARRVGDIALWLGLRTREECETLTPPKVAITEVFSTKTFRTGQVDVLQTPNASGRRLVLLRTSNSAHLLPLLALHFSRIVAVASTTLYFEVLESEQPHVVIAELPERYLAIPAPAPDQHRVRMPRDFEAETFFEATGCALPLPGAVVRDAVAPAASAPVVVTKKLASKKSTAKKTT